MIERYVEMCKWAIPRFSEAEWVMLCDALRNVHRLSAMYVTAVVREEARARGLAEKWGVDEALLLSKLDLLDLAARVAVLDAVERRRVWSAE